jgi:argininosuccinate lyase
MRQWGGRFSGSPSEMMLRFQESLSYDQRLWPYDIAGSKAHVKMLLAQGILTQDEAKTLLSGLAKVEEDFSRGEIPQDIALEDIHTAVETALRGIVGDLAGKVHTGRSRNDQSALDMHLWCVDAAKNLGEAVRRLQKAFFDQAGANKTLVMPGYTHLQRAQPVLLAHHLLAYFFMLQRDHERFEALAAKAAVSPLGSAALAGSTFPLDPISTARELGLSGTYDNSMDAVSDRDHLLELCFACSTAMAHLSRFAEEVVLWTTPEFGFAVLADAVTTGSSIMPQKKNADSAELIRGKAGRVFGNLIGLLTTVKGLPLTYCKDLQEDKEAVFECFDVTLACLDMATQVVEGLTWNPQKLEDAARDWPLMATDLADFLARNGMPFRDAHKVVGGVVRRCMDAGKSPKDLTAQELAQFSPLLTPEVCAAIFDPHHSVSLRDHLMGTGPGSVEAQLAKAAAIFS